MKSFDLTRRELLAAGVTLGLARCATEESSQAPASTAPAGPLYLSNVFEGWLLLRYGWFSPFVFRLSFYLFWHILYGGLAHA